MKIIQKCKKMLLMVIMCLVLSAGTVPAMNAYAETVQTETVQTDAQKVQKTVYSIQSRLGYPVYDTLLHALCHFEGDRGTAVLGYLVRAFAQGRGISDQLADPFALRVMELSRKVDNELDKLLGFVRFQDLGSILVAQLAPKCNMVPLMMDHFPDRFRMKILFSTMKTETLLPSMKPDTAVFW